MALCWAIWDASSLVKSSLPATGFAARLSSSTAFTALRTSPPQPVAMVRGTSSSQERGRTLCFCTMPRARSTAGTVSSAVRGLNSNTVLRESRALYT